MQVKKMGRGWGSGRGGIIFTAMGLGGHGGQGTASTPGVAGLVGGLPYGTKLGKGEADEGEGRVGMG